MRTAIYRRAGTPLQVEHVADPRPGPCDVVIKVGRCGICGTDLAMTSAGPIQYAADSALGHEYAGEIVELGSQVTTLAVGDRVAAMPIAGCGQCDACRTGDFFFCARMQTMMGGFGEYNVARASACTRLSASLSIADGALVEPLAVGLRSVDKSGLTPGADVLVMGSGPIALATVFWARRRGVRNLTVMARSDRHRHIAEHMGATRFVSFEAPEAANLRPQFLFECTGAPGMLARAIDLVAPRGTVMLSGICLQPDTLMPGAGVFKEITIRSTVGYNADEFNAAADAFACGAVAPRLMVTETISLSELPARFEALRTDRSACKVLVDPWATVPPPGASDGPQS
jgi:threonine dehydrogenase-like Zn-dependent dehydrogenase